MVVLQRRYVVAGACFIGAAVVSRSGSRTARQRSRDPGTYSPRHIRAAVAGAVVMLLAVVGGLVFFGQAVRQSTEQDRQAQVAQASERFSRSVEQLGASTIAVRMGAVYSFARLMRESPGDQRAISEVLSGFVRGQAAQAPHPQGYQPVQTPPADVLAALTVLADQPHPRGTDQNGAELPTMLLRGVDFSGFDLRTAVLRNADLTGANLSRTDLYRADLTDTNLANATLTSANLFLTNLTSANLAKANLTYATLEFANLQAAQLFAADLTSANLREADLTGAYLIGANLAHADLEGANLTNTDLADSDLTGTNLTALTCSETTWPEGFRPPC